MAHAIDVDWVRDHARGNKTRVVCPACAPTRKAKGDKTLTIINDEHGVGWKCWHCGAQGIAKTKTRETTVTQVKEAVVVPMRGFTTEPLDDDALAYLTERGISQEIADLCGVVAGTRWFRKIGGERRGVGFVYRAKDRDYAAKWRAIEAKDFTQDGSAQTLYLSDRLKTHEHLIITEGELDALSFWQAGLPFAVSIPSGAVQANEQDGSARLKFLAHHESLLRDARTVFLAVDADGAGKTTAQELARRIGKAKCWSVTYPEGCKDANDVLVKHGADALREVIGAAQPWPVEGIATPRDYMERVRNLYRDGLPRGLSTGWSSVDEVYTLNPGNLILLTGVPGHGKSSWLDALLVNAMKQHNWRVAYASFESPPELHLARLAAMHTGKPFGHGPNPRMSQDEMEDALAWVDSRVTFLTHDGVMPTTQSLIDRFETAVLRSGVKACVVDPFNFIKLNGRDGGVDTEAIGEMLAEFKMFAQRAEVAFFLVAHPAKPMGQQADWVPTGYSVAGSAHFYNRADFGLTMHRNRDGNTLHVWKAKWAHQGQIGQVPMSYDHTTGGFVERAAQSDADIDLDFEGTDDDAPF